MAKEPKQSVLEFMDCWRRLDVEDAAVRISENAVYQPDPRDESVRGRAAIRALLSEYMGRMGSYSMEIRQLLASDQVVFLERVERLSLTDGRQLTLQIVGVFELDDDGKISAWRDYWDTGMAAAQMATQPRN